MMGSIRGPLQAYLGHRSIGNTVRYTELAPTRFKDFGGEARPLQATPPTRWAVRIGGCGQGYHLEAAHELTHCHAKLSP